MTGIVREGWYEDPERRHQYRWFSQGSPTDLVMDNHETSQDPISVTDPAVYASMDLAEPPDDGPVVPDDEHPPLAKIVDLGGGTVSVVNTAAAGEEDPYRPGD